MDLQTPGDSNYIHRSSHLDPNTPCFCWCTPVYALIIHSPQFVPAMKHILITTIAARRKLPA